MNKPRLTANLARRLTGAGLALTLAFTSPALVNAEDIDLFVGAADKSGAANPNILIIVDNSANWSTAKQNWDKKLVQGESELRALKAILNDLRAELVANNDQPRVNLGLMFHRSGSGSGPDGGIVRFAIRPMDLKNVDAFLELIGAEDGTCPDATNTVNGTTNCIYQNMKTTGREQTNVAQYGSALFDAFKYFGGRTSPAYATVASANQVIDPKDWDKLGKKRHFDHLNAASSYMDTGGYNADFSEYVAPAAALKNAACAKHYIIFIGNGFPGSENTTTDSALGLKNVNVDVTPALPTQLAVPNFTSITTTVTKDLDPIFATCSDNATCVANAVSTYGNLFTDVNGNPNYACVNGTQDASFTGAATACQSQSTCETTTGPALLPGHVKYVCSGGTSNASATNTSLAADAACRTNNAAGVTACQVNAATVYGTQYDLYTCAGGATDNTQLSTSFSGSCITQAQCETQAALPPASGGLNSGQGYTSFACSGGSNTGPCGGSPTLRRNWTVNGRVIFGGTPCTGKGNMTVTGTLNACASPSKRNQTITAFNTATPCTGINFKNWTQQGKKEVTTVTALTTFGPPKFDNYADEWAKFLYQTDVSELEGQQNVTTYTIDVFKDKQEENETALLFNMAKHGGGRYFQATQESAIIDALRAILIEIQSVNSVFASASLPINSTNRSQNENQVFIGMFRPDAGGSPRWYGNLKQYKIAEFGTNVFKLADSSTPPREAVTEATGFIHPCAVSFWTVDSGSKYWFWQNGSAGQCTTAGNDFQFSDLPDGPLVEKGAVAEVIRRGNVPPSTAGAQDPLATPEKRVIYTCADEFECCPACAASKATTLVPFDKDHVDMARVGHTDPTLYQQLLDYTIGWDTEDEKKLNIGLPGQGVRPSVHGDVAHSRPLPVNYGNPTDTPVPPHPDGVVLFYGANDGTFRAVRGKDGQEVWAFIAPEHHAGLERLRAAKPPVLYPNQTPVPDDAVRKDYFFDGSSGLFQNKDNSKVWVFPSMRRGGRMIYGFDVTDVTKPSLLWKAGCTDANPKDPTDFSSCIKGFEKMGQTWSLPSAALVKGWQSGDPNKPVIIMGGGYDRCEDQDAAPNSECTTDRMGNRVYVIDAVTGERIREFDTLGSVAADVTLVDVDFDGFADHAYAADTLGNIYRVDFVKPNSPSDVLTEGDWTMTHIGKLDEKSNRKFLFGPAALATKGKTYLTIVSGDREHPLINNYPFPKGTDPGVLNRAYMLVDTFIADPTKLPVNMDDPDVMEDVSGSTACPTPGTTPEDLGKLGWFFDLKDNGNGEQGVTSSLIFAGLVFFSTNRPEETLSGACENKLGQARGYAVNLLNASGAADTLNICGGARSQIFKGGGLPPSPVTGTVPVGADGKPVTVMIGGVQRGGGVSSPIGAQRVTPTITQTRNRRYWYTDSDK